LKQSLPSRVHRAIAGAVFLALWILLAAPLRAGDEAIFQIRQGADTLWRTLESMPYAADGDGAPVFIFEFSECPHSQSLYRDWRGKLQGVQLRHMFYAVSQRSANEMAALSRSRDLTDYQAFMEGTKAAPLADDPRLTAAEYNRNVAHFNAIMKPLDAVVEPTLRANGVMAGNLVSPTLVWREGDAVFASGGYEYAHMARVLERVLAASAGSRTTAPAPAAVAGAATTAEAAGAAPGGARAEIVGIRLGMTQDQAIAAIRAYNPRLAVSEHATEVTIQDSNRQPLQVDRYVSEVWGDWNKSVQGYQNGEPIEKLVVVFASPPAAHHVQFVERDIRYVSNDGPATDVLLASIRDKYGEPTRTSSSGHALLWQYGAQRLTMDQFNRWVWSSELSGRRTSHAYRSPMFPTVGPDMPKNVLQMNSDGISFRFGGQEHVDAGRSLGVHVVPQGQGTSHLRMLLSEGVIAIGSTRYATQQMAQTALAAHEQKLRQAAVGRKAPAL
jgi:hypothetical protein